MCLSRVTTPDLSPSTLTIHVYMAGPAQSAKHLLTTTRTTHDRSTRGNFGLGQVRIAASLPRTCQASDSVPTGSAEQRRCSGTQVVGLCLAIDAQRHRRVMAVPARNDVHRDARREHEAHAGVP